MNSKAAGQTGHRIATVTGGATIATAEGVVIAQTRHVDLTEEPTERAYYVRSHRGSRGPFTTREAAQAECRWPEERVVLAVVL